MEWYIWTLIGGAAAVAATFLFKVRKKDTMRWLGIAAVILGLVFMGINGGWFEKTGSIADQAKDGSVNIVTGSTTVTFTGVDTQSAATVGTVSYIGKDGQALRTGVTTADQGDELVVLLSNSTGQYHDGFWTGKVPDGKTTFTPDVKMLKNASVTVALYNTAKQAITNGGGATNQTVTTGSSPTMELDLTGTSLANTGKMTCVLETNGTAQVNKMALSGFGAVAVGTSKPSSYSLTGTGSGVWIYDIDDINDASLRVGSLYVEAKSGQDPSATIAKISCFSKEYFIDSNAVSTTINAFAQKVAEPNVYYGIEDSQGTLKSRSQFTFTAVLQ